jgi:hypothetical protein
MLLTPTPPMTPPTILRTPRQQRRNNRRLPQNSPVQRLRSKCCRKCSSGNYKCSKTPDNRASSRPGGPVRQFRQHNQRSQTRNSGLALKGRGFGPRLNDVDERRFSAA